ncbi:MAG: IS66 family insertion sequence element accessory protein TnpB [Deltaproteobacteria bacterium]|nr:IS66 family insertion sequence element accessory protein TnpB [Deltaproteobacteria bacterium]
MPAKKTPTAAAVTRFAQIAELPAGFDLLGALLPKNAKRALFYLLPIRMSWGPKKLKAIIDETLSEGVDDDTAYVFTNSKRDSLLVYWRTDNGEQTMQRQAQEGAFVYPGYADGLPWASVESKSLRNLMRG